MSNLPPPPWPRGNASSSSPPALAIVPADVGLEPDLGLDELELEAELDVDQAHELRSGRPLAEAARAAGAVVPRDPPAARHTVRLNVATRGGLDETRATVARLRAVLMADAGVTAFAFTIGSDAE